MSLNLREPLFINQQLILILTIKCQFIDCQFIDQCVLITLQRITFCKNNNVQTKIVMVVFVSLHGDPYKALAGGRKQTLVPNC